MGLSERLKFDADGLVTAVVQDAENGRVLMVGYMNREAVERTLREGKVCFWSRSRRKLWTKGETSGNFLLVRDVYVDCDADCLLVKAEPVGPTCHEGYQSCFYRRVDPSGELEAVGERLRDPKDMYSK